MTGLLLCLFPLLAAAAPVPKEPLRPSAKALRDAIGKSHLSKELRAVGRAMGADPVIRYALWNQEVPENAEETHFYLSWKAKGLELCFERNTLHTVWVHNEQSEGFKRFVGELPEGLNFTNTPAAVEKSLGKPEKVLETPASNENGKAVPARTDWLFKQKGLCVSFTGTGDKRLVLAIALFPPGDAPCW